MGLTIRQYLRFLSKEQLKRLFEETDLEDDEFWILTYSFIENRMVVNTCRKLSISEGKYHYTLNNALIKVKFTIINNPNYYSLV